MKHRHDIPARDPKAVRLLVGGLEDVECLIAQRLHLPARLKRSTAGHPERMITELRLDELLGRVRGECESLLVQVDRETEGAEHASQHVAIVPRHRWRARGFARGGGHGLTAQAHHVKQRAAGYPGAQHDAPTRGGHACHL